MLIEREQLVEDNSKLAASQSVGELVWQRLAGALVQLLSASIAVLMDAPSFLASALSLDWIRAAPEPPSGGEQLSPRMERAIAEGLRFVFGEPLLRTLTSSVATLVLCISILETVFTLYLTRQVGITPLLLGIILASGSVGFVLGALLAGWLTLRVGIGMTLLIAPLVIGGSDLLIPWLD